ncbi:MAG TPA: TonB family protein [Terriglobales bacterium]|jgi:protein TonB|nr:TonB family protein [Terriglobales bacterium]
MFEDSLVESSGRIRTKRGWTTLLSFSLQILFMGGLILLPLIYTEALPRQQLMSFLVAPPPPPPPPPPAAAVPVKIIKVESDIVNGELRTPTKIPEKIKMVQEDAAPPPVTATGGVVGGVPGGVPGGSLGGVIGGIIGSTPTAVPKMAVPQRIRVSSGVAQGMLIQEVRPVYPPMAKMARVQGTVVLAAVISKAGTIEGLKVVSGHPMLIQAAVDAVQQWRYKPYMLSGEPVEVDTQISVVFTLSGS